jgi:NDP-sugar pyrophosphorylase family protein
VTDVRVRQALSHAIDREALGTWNGEVLSMERDILPRLVRERRLHGVILSGPFIDIGLPETYAAAADFVRRLREEQAPGTRGQRDLSVR